MHLWCECSVLIWEDSDTWSTIKKKVVFAPIPCWEVMLRKASEDMFYFIQRRFIRLVKHWINIHILMRPEQDLWFWQKTKKQNKTKQKHPNKETNTKAKTKTRCNMYFLIISFPRVICKHFTDVVLRSCPSAYGTQ